MQIIDIGVDEKEEIVNHTTHPKKEKITKKTHKLARIRHKIEKTDTGIAKDHQKQILYRAIIITKREEIEYLKTIHPYIR